MQKLAKLAETENRLFTADEQARGHHRSNSLGQRKALPHNYFLKARASTHLNSVRYPA